MDEFAERKKGSVSYTQLDVYKRQAPTEGTGSGSGSGPGIEPSSLLREHERKAREQLIMKIRLRFIVPQFENVK